MTTLLNPPYMRFILLIAESPISPPQMLASTWQTFVGWKCPCSRERLHLTVHRIILISRSWYRDVTRPTASYSSHCYFTWRALVLYGRHVYMATERMLDTFLGYQPLKTKLGWFCSIFTTELQWCAAREDGVPSLNLLLKV